MAQAISVPWDRYIVGGLKTLYSGDKVVIGNTATTTNATLEVVGQIASGYYTATSTTATSTFSGDLRFDAELLPDGLTCANGEILKKQEPMIGIALLILPALLLAQFLPLPLLQSAIWLIGLQPLIHRFLAQLPLPP